MLLVHAASSPCSKSLSKGSSAYKSSLYPPVQHYQQKHPAQMHTDVFSWQVLSTRKEVTLSCFLSNTDAVVRFLSPQPRKQEGDLSPHHEPLGPAAPFPGEPCRPGGAGGAPGRGSARPWPGPSRLGGRKRGPAASHRPPPSPRGRGAAGGLSPLFVGTNISPSRCGNSPRPGLGEGGFPSHCLPGSALPAPAPSESEWPGGTRRRARVRHQLLRANAALGAGPARIARLQICALTSIKKSAQCAQK